MKKFLTLLIVTLLWAFNATAVKVENADGKTIYYFLSTTTDTAKVTYDVTDKYSGDIVIPSQITYNGKTYKVIEISEYAFSSCSGLTSITIPESVTTIGIGAFLGCTGLTAITIPNSVTTIDDSAFCKCTGLTSITIPNSVTTIDDSAFEKCTGLTAITIPESVTTIEKYAFSECTGLTAITIPNSVTTIKRDAFSHCTGLTAITIPNSVTTIEQNAFYGCTGLTAITIPSSISSISISVFSQCTALTTVEIPNSVTSIKGYAFKDCSNLSSVTIPNSVTAIDRRAFQNCTGLKTLRIEDGNSELNLYGTYDDHPDYVFEGCNIENLYIGRKLSNWKALCVSSSLKTLEFGKIFTTIDTNVFVGCTGLTSVVLPKTLTSISYRTFAGCTSLTTINIPSSVSLIDAEAFMNCTSLNSITIPRSVKNICSRAFQNCSGLKTLRIEDSNSVLSLDKYYNPILSGYPFGECQIENLYIGRNISDWKALCNSPSLKNVEIGNSVTSIGGEAFRGCSGLTEITIPASVTEIGNEAFRDCSGLTSIKIPNSITSLGEYIFADCSSLASIDIPSSVTKIPQYAFQGCANLTYIKIPASVISIYYGAFDACTGLKTLYIEDSYTKLNFVSSSYRPDAFNNCRIEDIYVGRDLSSWQCCSSSLKKVEIGDAVNEIGTGAFRGCSELTEITIPTYITSIQSQAFNGCNNLIKIYAMPNNPPSCSSTAFEGFNQKECTLYVRENAIDKYKKASYWKNFANVETIESLYLHFDEKEITLETGATGTFNVTSSNLPEGTQIMWKSSNPEVVSVDDNGTYQALAAGTATITAYCDLASATCTVTVIKKEQTITWTQTFDNCHVGDKITLEAVASSGLNVEFTLYEATDCASLEGNELTILKEGSFKVQASQPGDDNYNAAKPVVKQITVEDTTRKDQTITWTQTFDNCHVGDKITLEAVASSGLSVEFTLYEATDCASLEGNELTILKEGSFKVQASQPGNDKYNAAEPVVKQITVVSSGIDDCESLDEAVEYRVYNLNGLAIMVAKSREELKTLSSGLYVINGKKVVIR